MRTFSVRGVSIWRQVRRLAAAIRAHERVKKSAGRRNSGSAVTPASKRGRLALKKIFLPAVVPAKAGSAKIRSR